MKTKFNIFIPLIVTYILLSFSACNKDDMGPLVATNIMKEGVNQTATVGATLPNPIIITVKDQKGNLFKGATVKFSVLEGATSVTSSTTDNEGKASTSWTLGNTVGVQTLSIEVFKNDGITPIEGSPFQVAANAVALAPTRLLIVSGNNQENLILDELGEPIVVEVQDQNDNAFASAEVIFSVKGGSVSNDTVLTNSNGYASVTWTLGKTIGKQTLTASILNSSVEFEATGNEITVTDIDNNTYKTIVIGNTVWMAENLKVTRYADGTAIPLLIDENNNGSTNDEWAALGDNDTDKAYCYYNDNAGGEKEIYGALYTHAAATNGDNDGITQGVCPTGWHLPGSGEWWDELVGSTTTIYKASWLAGNPELWADGELKSQSNFGESGFDALPGGFRSRITGEFSGLGETGTWWTSTNVNSEAVRTSIRSTNSSSLYLAPELKSVGRSVRCVRD